MTASLDEQTPRRRMLLGLGWVSFLISLLGPVLANVRFLFPNVVYEGESVLKLDSLEKYPVGSITFFAEKKIVLFREKDGFRACTAVCPHLRCVISPFVGAPARLSGYIEGPVPVPRQHFRRTGTGARGACAARARLLSSSTKSPDGRVVVDTRKVVAPSEHFKI